MTQFPEELARLRRPRLLVRAARFGLADYRRERDLARLLPGARPKSPRGLIDKLIDLEERQDARRRNGDAGYSYARHIEILIALMAEARSLTAMHTPEPAPSRPAPCRHAA
ncbi:hypothetical protein SAMN05444722_0721 [Rhodovulum sp. ES.010]|uniref:DUF6477 family protein n=1 Tax=Rhodovulum sp. ES.010 TaxID=1882821 RepID=UPI00092C1FA3|nr:DUF6477 family protein [Rhodovulum sp. ES.010]SIO17949.1 hypothetical protein SAMN05444722_0721 [Rhodovulum sp. ES.010]